jgi:thioredoxin 1
MTEDAGLASAYASGAGCPAARSSGSYYILYSNGAAKSRRNVFDQRAIRREEVTGKLPDVTDGTFQSEVLDAEQPVLVDFWAPWCGPCRVVHPILEEMATERDDLRIVSLNTDENQQTAAQYEVLSIPTLILFKDGAEAKRVIGAMPKRRLESELEPALA